ncbi:restriction endonuclease subunit S [Billgrantia sp. LNSP4103-1]|uniref:restriction endonuclease subunit S n=1 Tax=Billgrantia sp. LNSP4103-1 TaxID=3410266 RepID=UPI00403F5D1F
MRNTQVQRFKKVPLDEVAVAERGKFSARPRNDPQYYNGSIPFLQTGDIARAGRNITSWEKTLNDKGLAVSKVFPQGAILMAIAANVGDVAISTFSAACPDSVVAVSPRRNIDKEWLFQTLKFSTKSLAALATQNAQANLSLEKITPFKVYLPTNTEQEKIGKTLRTWDDTIEKTKNLINARERQHTALTHQLVFGKRRLGHFKSSEERTRYRWFDLPAEWTAKPIGEIALEASVKNSNGNTAEVLSCTKYDGFVRSLDYFKKQVFSNDLSGYKVIHRGEFGFPSNHVEEGSIGLQNIVDAGLVSPIYTVFRFQQEIINNDYAYAALKTSLYKHIFEVSTSASVDRRGSLRWSQFAKIPFPVPPLAEQEAISAVLKDNQRVIDCLKEERDALIRQKRGLMQKLLTGEWRLTNEVKMEAAG